MTINIDQINLGPLVEEVSRGKLSRRHFLKHAALLGISANAVSAMLMNAAQAAGPKKGGILKLAMGHGSTSDSIDPAALINGYQWALCYAHRDTLIEVGPGGVLLPSLAESWEASADASSWTFKLRPGVEFHNGKALALEDVVASINHHRTDDTKSFMKPVADEILEIKTDGDNVITFVLKAGNADFPFTLNSAGFSICPATSEGGIDWESGIGTGGYVLKDYNPGVIANLERNPNYWDANRAHADSVQFLTIADPVARNNALVTGEVDVIDQVDLKTVNRLSRVPGVVVEETAGPLHYTFPMNLEVAPFNDNNVRNALKYAINREELLQKILRGHGSIGNDHPIGPSYRFHGGDLEQIAYDPDKAKFYLKEAGLSDLTLDLSASDAAFAGAVDAVALYKEHAAKAGITINIVREPNDGYWSNVWGVKPWCASYWGGYATESEMFTTGYSPGAAWNDTKWNNEKFNKLMAEAKAELDENKRRDMYIEMQRMLRDEGGALVPMFGNDVLARSEKVAHGELSSDRGFDGRRIISRWWVV